MFSLSPSPLQVYLKSRLNCVLLSSKDLEVGENLKCYELYFCCEHVILLQQYTVVCLQSLRPPFQLSSSAVTGDVEEVKEEGGEVDEVWDTMEMIIDQAKKRATEEEEAIVTGVEKTTKKRKVVK